jgi:hypothetical protein
MADNQILKTYYGCYDNICQTLEENEDCPADQTCVLTACGEDSANCPISQTTILGECKAYDGPICYKYPDIEVHDLFTSEQTGECDQYYYCAQDGMRYTIPCANAYAEYEKYRDALLDSWYEQPVLKSVTKQVTAAIALAGNVVMRAGTYLIRIDTVPKVYAVAPGGKIHLIRSDTVGQYLFGLDWQDKIVIVYDGFFANYTDSNEPLDGTVYPHGQLVYSSLNDQTYYVNEDGTWSAFVSYEAFIANNFREEFVVMAPDDMGFKEGQPISGYMPELFDPSFHY